MLSTGGSVAAVRRAATAQLDKELKSRDSGRATRYVATVWPCMAALRYHYTMDESCDDKMKAEEGDVASPDVPMTEEGEETPAEKTKGKVSELGMELPGEVVTAFGSVAKVRSAVKRSRREDKQRRAARRAERKAREGDDVGRAVAELDDALRGRRRQHQDEARRELERRRRQRRSNLDERTGSRASVHLVQRQGVVTSTGTTNVVEAADGLPTATVLVDGKQQAIKIDSGAQYTVAGTDWMMRDERVNRPAPVDFIEGISGFLLDVLGVWSFEMRNVFGQTVAMEACVIGGCSNEFLVGVDFLEHHKTSIDFKSKEVRFNEREQLVVIPFRTSSTNDDGHRARVRLVSTAKLQRRAVQPLEVSVAAPDGEEDIFVPTGDFGSQQ
ncbi:hypothetical protein PR003_g24542 [Phytophthora rubi]|nr:hypothetical protein PR003_g24542 [Phytophthora rubi]